MNKTGISRHVSDIIGKRRVAANAYVVGVQNEILVGCVECQVGFNVDIERAIFPLDIVYSEWIGGDV